MSDTAVSYQSFIGVDLHKETVSLTAVDPRGEALTKLKISTKSVGKIEAWLQALPRPSQMAVEAVGFVEWFIERFRPCVDRIEIADATELSNRRGKRRKHPRARLQMISLVNEHDRRCYWCNGCRC